MHISGSRIPIPFVGCLLCAPVFAQATQRVSLAFNGAQGNGDSGTLYVGRALISANSRFVAFESLATNLVPGDTNGAMDIFLRDRVAGTTERVSVDSNGQEANGVSDSATMSADGRFVAFRSFASNLVAHDATAFAPDIFLHDNYTGETRLISVRSDGVQGNNASHFPAISADGLHVAFESLATNLVSGDTNAAVDVFEYDILTGETRRVSIDSSGQQANGDSFTASISGDGRFVAFRSNASNLVPNDTDGNYDTFVHDRVTGATACVSVQPSGESGGGWDPNCSVDGRYVAFSSGNSGLVPGDTNNTWDVFVRDLQTSTTVRVSVSSAGGEGNMESYDPAISADGHFVTFRSYASTLVDGDTNGSEDVFVHDCWAGTTVRVSVDSAGIQGQGDSFGSSISADGRTVAFYSAAGNLVAGDTNGTLDTFVRDMQTGAFATLCEPGVDGVVACPCSNQPVGADRGCENSSGTGGASLTATGSASLSMDTLAFATSGESPAVFSIVMQGNSAISSGVTYGRGVRCLGGPLIRRLFVKNAVVGCITAPEASEGDPSVSARSAAKGDVIQPGEARWYLVYYRDPIAFGSCPASSTFNCTQTGRVDWTP